MRRWRTTEAVTPNRAAISSGSLPSPAKALNASNWSAGCLMVSYFHQALLNGIETEVRKLQDDEQILLRNGTISGMNELPPAAD